MDDHKIELPSEQFMSAMEVTAHISLLVLIATYCILLWVCLTKSPAAMSGYKWWLVINGTTAVLFEVMFTLTMPVLLLPYPMLYLDGYATRNHIFSALANELYDDLFFFISFLVSYVIMVMFLFRYAQTNGNLAYKIVFSSWKMNVVISVVALSIIAVSIYLPNHLYIVPREELLSILNETAATVYVRIRDRNVIGTSTRWSSVVVTYFSILYLTMTVLVAAAIVFSLFDSYRFMKHNANNFSNKTKMLYLNLLHSLTIDVILGLILVACPVCAVLLAAFTSPYTPLVGIVAFRIEYVRNDNNGIFYTIGFFNNVFENAPVFTQIIHKTWNIFVALFFLSPMVQFLYRYLVLCREWEASYRFYTTLYLSLVLFSLSLTILSNSGTTYVSRSSNALYRDYIFTDNPTNVDLLIINECVRNDNYGIFYTIGFFNNVFENAPVFTQIIHRIWNIFLALYFLSPMVQFLYRYLVLCREWEASYRLYTTLYLSLVLFSLSLTILSNSGTTYVSRASNALYRDYIFTDNPTNVDLLLINNASQNSWPMIVWLMIVAVSITIVVVCGIKIWLHLRRYFKVVSDSNKRNQRMHTQINYILYTQGFMTIGNMATIFLSYLLGLNDEYMSALFQLVELIIMTVNPLLTVLLVDSYRQAALNVFLRKSETFPKKVNVSVPIVPKL